MHYARIETGLTLCQPHSITPRPAAAQKQEKDFNVYVLNSFCLHFTLSETEVLNSLEEFCITRVATVNSSAKVLNPRGRPLSEWLEGSPIGGVTGVSIQGQVIPKTQKRHLKRLG